MVSGETFQLAIESGLKMNLQEYLQVTSQIVYVYYMFDQRMFNSTETATACAYNAHNLNNMIVHLCRSFSRASRLGGGTKDGRLV